MDYSKPRCQYGYESFCGPVVNAAQGVASQISSALNSFCSNLSVAFRPQLVHSYAEGNYSRTTNMMFTMSKAMFLMMTMMVIPLSLEMNFVLNIGWVILFLNTHFNLRFWSFSQ